ncbi:MAG TPA: flagellar hook capping FlgD N-terminal domain-containing protein [Hypericibacter adhaerens]|jgi:flagellar basal-body rod modification protein FlgD|uniref:flagellar hook assembly protein FlgD n=1 Tax=Hypericibacter adhaerens TaxID=2602016 RepID=UPI002C6C9E77|nr:flagellar hook capping FlgD N-terminal domain-containing protein [Hypericibacter adhaerens]HWA44893.1 flagellar hook capping FlgD N-terminal domain-containing protein [Hypericibacter adhaerens]
MTTVNGVGTSSTGTSSNGGSSALSSFSNNFDNFLTLLTKQLQYQDPLSPLDTNQFTQQLVEFTSVEQQIETNQKLDSLLAVQSDNQAMAALSFLNNVVEAQSDQVMLQDGSAEISYDLSSEAETATLVIKDADGNTVRTIPVDTTTGTHDVTWDGKDKNGNALEDGVYDISVQAVDSDGVQLAVTTGTRGKVDAVQRIDGEFHLSIGDLDVPLSKVGSVRSATAGSSNDSNDQS